MREALGDLRDDNTPLYLQFAQNLRAHIESGAIKPGRALPPERGLSEMAGLSRVTVRKAIGQLIAEGVVVRKQGSGTFVAQRIEAPGSALTSFTDDARMRGETPGVVWMAKGYAEPTPEEAAALETSVSQVVARLSRVRLAAGEPLAIEHAVVPKEFLPDLSIVDTSLYLALQSNGFRPTAGTQRVRASLASPTEAGILRIMQNSEVMRIERIARIPDGRVVEFTRSVYRGDRYDFVTEIKSD